MLLVSIHDVSPAQASSVARLWSICRERGITPALLVVPDWHGEWPLEAHPRFVEWVRSRSADGAEIVVHGERHDEVGLSRNLADRWRAWGKTKGEGEFLTLDGPAASERLGRALRRLRDLGLDPQGFVPPAWLARENTHQAVAAAGLRFSEDDHSVRLHPSERQVRSPVVRWSARSSLRAWGSVAVAAARSVLQLGARFPRIALHPHDLDHPATAASVIRTLECWLARHSPGSYADLQARVLSA